MQNQKFQALSRICLNNWHYIDKRVLSFAEGINFLQDTREAASPR